ncbi:MAG: hypothetical protein F9K16_14235 [Thermoanaerobaculia bacterium]|nr:MAG: hypothetical protein F9K16_14235 [Thermoanaerobaculia bacterium]
MNAANPLLEQIRSGASPELELLAAKGILPLSPEELVPLQVHLTGSDDPKIAACAREALAGLEPGVATEFLAAEANEPELRWFAFGHPDPRVIEAVLRRRDTPRGLLAEVAPRLSPDLQEALLLRQDAIVEHPAILDALEANPGLSLFARRRIQEYREHLLPREGRQEPAPAEPFAAGPAALTPEELAEIEQVRSLPAQGDIDERTGLSESQVRALPVPVRIKLGQGAGRTLRSILIRDSNRLVALAVLANSAFSEEEVEQVASNRSIDDEVLTFVSRRRQWISRYGVCRALVQNPRTPVGISVRLVARLSVKDLKALRFDRNIPEPVRSTADRLYRIKSA